MILDLGLIASGLVLLLVAGDMLVRGAVALALRLGVAPFIVSLTVVAFGTSAPELLIGVQAVLEDMPGLALGNVVGSNIANVLLVLGVPALMLPLIEQGAAVRRSFWMMIAASVVLMLFAATGALTGWHGLALLVGLAMFLWQSCRSPDCADAAVEELEEFDTHLPPSRIALLMGAGLIGLPLGAHLLVGGAENIARAAQIPEEIIGLTIVALGTSLPELATTVMAARRGQADVAIGNVVGSNLFNILAILGVSSLVGVIPVAAPMLVVDMPVMLATSLLLALPILFGIAIGRVIGAIWLGLYVLYIAMLL